MRDSSAIHAHDPKFDGARMVMGCSRKHLRSIQEQYRQRPFIDAELRAGKIERVLDQHPGGLSQDEPCEQTGLNPDQIELAVTWKSVNFLLLQHRFGKGAASRTKGEGFVRAGSWYSLGGLAV